MNLGPGQLHTVYPTTVVLLEVEAEAERHTATANSLLAIIKIYLRHY
jgi:hypothetical protein